MTSFQLCSAHPDLELAGRPEWKTKRLRDEVMAEFVGTAVMIIFGNGVVASAGLSTGDDFAKQLFTNLAWGIAVCFGAIFTFDVSGAHLNPSVTFHAIVFGKFPLLKGVRFMTAQLLGAFVGALIITFNFIVLRGKKHLSNVYCTTRMDGISIANAFVNEFIATALLVAGIQAVVSHRPKPSKYHVGGFVGLLVFVIGNVFGPFTGYALNPARDFGPRMCWLVFAAIYGRSSTTCLGTHCLWSDVMGGGYFVIPIVAPLLGGLMGGLIFKCTIFVEIKHEQLPAVSFPREPFLPATSVPTVAAAMHEA